ALAAGQRAHLLLLIRTAEVEAGRIGARVDQLFTQPQLVVAVRNLLPDTLVGIEVVARLVDIGQLDRAADGEFAAVRHLLPDDHAEEGRFAGAVRPDDADDGAWRNVNGQVFVEERVAVPLADTLGADHDIAQARA